MNQPSPPLKLEDIFDRIEPMLRSLDQTDRTNAWNEVFQVHQPVMYKIALKQLSGQQSLRAVTANDIVNQAAAKLTRRFRRPLRDKIQSVNGLKKYINAALRSAFFDYLKKEPPHPTTGADEPHRERQAPTTGNPASRAEQSEAVSQLLETIEQDYGSLGKSLLLIGQAIDSRRTASTGTPHRPDSNRETVADILVPVLRVQWPQHVDQLVDAIFARGHSPFRQRLEFLHDVDSVLRSFEGLTPALTFGVKGELGKRGTRSLSALTKWHKKAMGSHWDDPAASDDVE